MTAIIIDGKEIARRKKDWIEKEVEQLKENNMTPGLAVIIVGNDPASLTYVKNKEKTCKQLGMHSILISFPEDISEQTLLDKINELNQDPAIHGILVQLPLPSHMNETVVIESINPKKDVDGFHPLNIGRMMTGQDCFLPCTPFGIMELLREIDVNIAGKNVVIVGRSNIVGKPAGQLFLKENATVTYCHSKTENLLEHTKRADIVISAVGKANLLSSEHIKNGAIVIDVGMNRNELGKLCGDVNFEEVKEKASYITPVPGGVGPMTITMLMYNTLKSARAFLNERDTVQPNF